MSTPRKPERTITIARDITMVVRDTKMHNGAVRPTLIVRGKGIYAYFSPTEAQGLYVALKQLDSEGLLK